DPGGLRKGEFQRDKNRASRCHRLCEAVFSLKQVGLDESRTRNVSIPGQCPACRANSVQSTLHPNYFTAAGVTESWISLALRCAACGCVDSIDDDGQTVERGRFEVDQSKDRLFWNPTPPVGMKR